MRADADTGGQGVERDRFRPRGDVVEDRPSPPRHGRGRCVAPRLAAATGAKPLLLGAVRVVVIADVRLPRAPCRARRPAVDAGRPDGEDELAVEAPVALENGLPGGIGVGHVGNIGRTTLSGYPDGVVKPGC